MSSCVKSLPINLIILLSWLGSRRGKGLEAVLSSECMHCRRWECRKQQRLVMCVSYGTGALGFIGAIVGKERMNLDRENLETSINQPWISIMIISEAQVRLRHDKSWLATPCPRPRHDKARWASAHVWLANLVLPAWQRIVEHVWSVQMRLDISYFCEKNVSKYRTVWDTD